MHPAPSTTTRLIRNPNDGRSENHTGGHGDCKRRGRMSIQNSKTLTNPRPGDKILAGSVVVRVLQSRTGRLQIVVTSSDEVRVVRGRLRDSGLPTDAKNG